MVAINSAIEVDLTGQVCAESIGSWFYSGFGGQLDFIRGAARSKWGKPIIALPSTAKNDAVSRIVPRLAHGAGVLTGRADVHYVVTEYGVAYLHGQHHPAEGRRPDPDCASPVPQTVGAILRETALVSAQRIRCSGSARRTWHHNRAVTSPSMSKNVKDAGCVWSRARRSALKLAPELSKYGVHPAMYTGEGCTGCGACFYCCPEPGALTVYRLVPPPKVAGASWRAEQRRRPMRQLCKGNVAVVKAAVLAGCRAFYGYPITPASEIAEYAALLIPEVGGTFLQAESEVAAINMVYGASSAGMRVMSASSGPGLSLMQEGMSYIAGAELPCVIVDVVRGGPGLGNIAPEQSDYFCVVKGGGHGCYRNIVLAPASVQEMFDLTVLAFELADRYRNPVVIMTDGYVGQMQEPLEIKLREIPMPEKDWAVKGTLETRKNLISSIFLEPDDLEAHIRKLEAKYALAQELESRSENYLTEDADILLVGFGIVSRVLRSTVDQLRAQGVKAGLFRPITLWPYPSRELRETAKHVKSVMVVELNTGMMVEDVRLSLNGSVPVEFYGRAGGNVPTPEEITAEVTSRMAALV